MPRGKKREEKRQDEGAREIV